MKIKPDSHASSTNKSASPSPKNAAPHDSVVRLISEYWNDFRRNVIDKSRQ